MKQKTISAIIVLLIFIPIILEGNSLFRLAILILGLIGLKEIIEIKESKKRFPLFVKFSSFVLLSILIFNNVASNELILTLDYKILSLILLFTMVPVVIYRNNDIYNITDAMYLVGSIILLGLSFNLLIIIRNYHILYLVYLFLITTMTDTYALFGGKLSGRHKLCPTISPYKTIEGAIIGTLVGTLIACAFYYIKIDDAINLNNLIIVTMLLSLMGQIGDLLFSSIKRCYEKKDFSNLMPGHGGVLDRLDSMILVLLGFIFFISII